VLDHNKTEMMLFQPQGRWGSFPYLGCPLPTYPYTDADGTLQPITVKHSLQYLGVFFTPTLNWELHMTILSNWAHGTCHSLRVLGNSVCGI
jgi:hypothetical protein